MNKKVLVTGASRGIGEAIAKKYAERGYFVIINYNRSKRNAEVLADNLGGFAVRADISNPKAVKAMYGEVTERFGGVDILINNAGISGFELFCDITEDSWDRMINTNLSGAYRVTQAFLPYMIHNKSGCIINISSMWGQTGSSCEVAYSAAKAGLIGMTKALAKELAPSGIRVNCIAPGFIDTDMNADVSKEVIDEFKTDIPLGRLGSAADIAEAAYFLGTDSASYITGQVLGVNGGYITT